MSRERDLVQLALHLRRCLRCQDNSQWCERSNCATMRRLWMATMGDPDADYSFPYDIPHFEAQPEQMTVQPTESGETVVTLREGVKQ